VENIQILFQDNWLVCINKPHGLLVHASSIAADANEHALQLLRNQIGSHVYPVHRLDRKTAGALLFAINPQTNSIMQQQFMNQQVKKTYQAIVRGHTPDEGTIDYPLMNDKGKKQKAVTEFKTLQKVELPISSGKFNASRYSLVEIMPLTGRMHQIRKHFAHIFHPVIGDRPYGCNKQNRFFLQQWNHSVMLLHAFRLVFQHPHSHQQLIIEAPHMPEFVKIAKQLGFELQVSFHI
jgi:tRNA pseudouridine65 synthase